MERQTTYQVVFFCAVLAAYYTAVVGIFFFFLLQLRAVEAQLRQTVGNVKRHEDECRRVLGLLKEAESRGDEAARDTSRVSVFTRNAPPSL